MASIRVPWRDYEQEIIGHLQALIRIDTANPPGNETAAAEYMAEVLRWDDIAAQVLESAPGRGNLVARLDGQDDREALMLLSHLDVVPVEADKWVHPPFSGALADGYVWGRGTLDTKNLTAMELVTVLLLKRFRVPLRRSVVLVASADEEAGGHAGIVWLRENHPEWVSAPFVINEGAGYDIQIGGRRFYTCQTGEKGFCRLTLTASGHSGHAAFRHRDTAITRLSHAMARIGETDLPMHPSASARRFVDVVTGALETRPRDAALVRELLVPGKELAALQQLGIEPHLADELYAMFRNTANVTIVNAGKTINVVPSEASARIDGRLIPGATDQSFLTELRAAIGDGCAVKVDHYSPALESDPESELYDAIRDAVTAHDPEASVVPYLVVGGTDARHIKPMFNSMIYGFKPMRQEPEAPRQALVHGHNERISVANLLFGTRVIFDVVSRFCA